MRNLRLPRPATVRRSFFTFALFAILWSPVASAATLAGRVVDPAGAAVAGARVVVTTPLGTTADRTTDGSGRFDIASLPAGSYEVRALADGFQADPIAVTLAGDEIRSVDVILRVSAVTESIVVSASQIDLPLSRAADSVTVIAGADLQARQIETVADAVRLVPALGVTRSGGRGAITSLFPRGGASNYTLVLIDGVRANAFGGGYDFGHLPAGTIDRIEIVRGPESALFGADAIGAVVQIVTKRGGRPRADALIEGGGQGTERFAGTTAGSRGEWSWGGGIEQSRTDGYTGPAPATGERVTNDDDHLRRASGSVEWRQPGGIDIFGSGNIGHDERGFPGPFGTNPIGAFTAVDRVSRGINVTRQAGVRVGHPWSSRARQRIDVSVFDLSSDFSSRFGASASGTRRVEGRVQEDVALGASLAVSGGLDVLRERGSSTFIVGTLGAPIPIHRTVTGTFAELRYVRGERLFVTGGARLEHLTRDAVEPNVTAFSARPAFADQSIDSLNPKIAVSYAVAGRSRDRRSTRLHASAGTGIRPPDAFEIAFTDNPDLRPERSRSVDAGIEQRVAGETVVLGATAFFNRYDDLLVTVGRSLRDASRYMTDNISNARARGFELTADARPLAPLTVRTSYTFLATAILSVDHLSQIAPPPFKVGDALIRRPRHQGALDMMYAWRGLTAFADVTTRSQVLDVEPSFGSFGGLFPARGYAVVNVGASMRIGGNLDVYARVLNATDRAYEEALGFPALRRSGIVGVRVAAGR
jgi:outer membrane cobalamin receptor